MHAFLSNFLFRRCMTKNLLIYLNYLTVLLYTKTIIKKLEEIYLAASCLGKTTLLATNTVVNNCYFSLSHENN